MCPETLPLWVWSSACVQPTFSPHSSSGPPWALSCCHYVCWHCSAKYIQSWQSLWSLRSQSNVNRYTFVELSDMHLVNNEARGNGHEPQRISQDRYPQQQLPHHTTFTSINKWLQEYGSLEINKHTVGHHRTVRTPDLEEAILDKIEEKPSSSTRTTTHDLKSHPSTTALCDEY
jgi:hypothetical protein